MTKYLKPDLLIIDDMDQMLPAKGGEILWKSSCGATKRSTLMTSNRPIEEWGNSVRRAAASANPGPTAPPRRDHRDQRPQPIGCRKRQRAHGQEARATPKNQSEIRRCAQRVGWDPRFPKPLL